LVQILISLFYDQLAAEHAHLSGELVFAGLFRQTFDRNIFAGGQLGVHIEILKNHHLRKGGGLLPVEDEAHGPPCLHYDGISPD